MKHSEEVVTTTQTVAQSNDASRFPKEAVSSTRSRITLADVDKLDSFELLYHLYKESGQDIIGCPQRAFAIFEKKRNALSVFTRQEKFVHVIPHNTDGVLGALNAAQTNGAIFIVKGEEVLCTIDDVTCRGITYGDAALRTLLKCQLKENSEERTKYGGRPQDERWPLDHWRTYRDCQGLRLPFSNDSAIVQGWTLNGQGIDLYSELDVARHLECGPLQKILPESRRPSAVLYTWRREV